MLARFATQTLIVYPVQALPSVAPTAWRPAVGDANAFLLRADSAIELALGGRGLATLWVFPKALQRAARRNPTYLIDPYTTRVAAALYVAMRKKDEPIPEPAAGVMRAHASVSDARYLFVPLEVRVDGIDTGGRLVARLAVVDARGSQVVWVGETMTAQHSTFSTEMIDELARGVADLVVPR